MKYFFLFLPLLLTVNYAAAQSHNTNCMRCKYSKNYVGKVQNKALDECACTTCEKTEAKEKLARDAEDARIRTARAQSYKVAQAAKQQALAEARRREALAQQQRAVEEAKEKIRKKEEQTKYAALVDKYALKTKDRKYTGNTAAFLANVEGFSDDDKRIYGLQLDGKNILELPYPSSTNSIRISRIGWTNYFRITDDTGIRIIDATGKRIKIDQQEYVYSIYDDHERRTSVKPKTCQDEITAYRLTGEFQQMGDEVFNGDAYKFVTDMEGVEAHRKLMLSRESSSGSGIQLSRGYRIWYAPTTAYILNADLKLEEQKTGFLIIHGTDSP